MPDYIIYFIYMELHILNFLFFHHFFFITFTFFIYFFSHLFLSDIIILYALLTAHVLACVAKL